MAGRIPSQWGMDREGVMTLSLDGDCGIHSLIHHLDAWRLLGQCRGEVEEKIRAAIRADEILDAVGNQGVAREYNGFGTPLPVHTIGRQSEPTSLASENSHVVEAWEGIRATRQALARAIKKGE